MLNNPKHRKLRIIRHVAGLGLGVCLMLCGSSMAVNGHPEWLSHASWDMLAYFIHGVGGIPFLSHIEPLWRAIGE